MNILVRLAYLFLIVSDLSGAGAFRPSRASFLVNKRVGFPLTLPTNRHHIHSLDISPIFRASGLSSSPSASVEAGGVSPSKSNSGDEQSSKITKRVWASRIFLAITVFWTGYYLGLRRITAFPSKRRFSLFSILVVFFALRDVWRSIPSWAKPGLVQRAAIDTKRLLGLPVTASEESKVTINSDSMTGSDDIADFTTLATKLNGVLEVGKRRLSPEVLINFNINASFLAFLQIIRQQKAQRARTRDELYASCGSPATANDLTGLAEWMDLADASYDELPNNEPLQQYLKNRGFNLIKHDKTALPGYLGHYVAIHESKNEAIIGVKGTSGMEDMITDMCSSAVAYELEDGPFVPDGSTSIRAHDGIFLSSKRLADDLQPLIENLLLPQGYRITLVGHSLGAAGSALVAVLLRSRLPMLQSEEQKETLKVFAFASPPVLDLESALACKPFVTTVINNSDVVTRCNAGPVLVNLEVLKTVNQKLQQVSGLSPDEKIGLPATIRLLAQRKTDDESILSAEELTSTIDKAVAKIGRDKNDEDQLFVAGKVILMYDLWEEQSKFERKQSENKASEEGYDYSADKAILTDPTAKVLRYLEFDGRMLEDHMAPSYKDSLRKIISEIHDNS